MAGSNNTREGVRGGGAGHGDNKAEEHTKLSQSEPADWFAEASWQVGRGNGERATVVVGMKSPVWAIIQVPQSQGKLTQKSNQRDFHGTLRS